MVPSGASTGSFEAIELRDKDRDRLRGKGVKKAVENVEKKIAKELEGENVYEQRKLDQAMIELDGTENKEKLGANSILACSLAISKAAASSLGMPLYRYIGGMNPEKLPCPMMNVLNGGKHADNNLSVQEFMIVPTGGKTFREKMEMGSNTYYKLKELLKESKHATAVGDEGGFAPDLENEEQAIIYLMRAIEEAGYVPGKDIWISLDVAASEMYSAATKMQGKTGYFFWKQNELKNKDEMIAYLVELTEKYPILSIEDGLDEEDWNSWKRFEKQIGDKVKLIGDDLFVTNQERLQKGIQMGVANSILIKPNQIGTLTETLDTIELAKRNGYTYVISHRSGETEDTTIADLAVATGAEFIKSGAPTRTDRVAKYNRLLEIEEGF